MPNGFRRKGPQGKQELPGILVGGVYPGSFSDFEEAVEFDELEQFLRRNEPYDEELDMAPPLPQQAIAVPGASLPSQTKPLSSSQSKSPSSKVTPKKVGEFDEFDSLDVTDDQIADLLESLGLDSSPNTSSSAAPATTSPPRGMGGLGKEAAQIAKNKADTRKVSATTPLTIVQTKPLTLRKTSNPASPPAAAASATSSNIDPKSSSRPVSYGVDPEGPSVPGESEVTKEEPTNDELAASAVDSKGVQGA